jgi:hypothetical protein
MISLSETLSVYEIVFLSETLSGTLSVYETVFILGTV